MITGIKEPDQMKRFKIKKLSKEQKALRRRILEISYKASHSHLGSCLSACDLIDAVYKHKRKDEIFILSNGHAGLGLYAVLEKYGLIKKGIGETLNVHPDRNLKLNIHVSTGSLGQGLPIALGLALADRSRNVYCMISDGECAEGSIWESFRLLCDLGLKNLRVIVNANGWGAYDPIPLKKLAKRIRAFGLNVVQVDGHDCKSISQSLRFRVDKKPLVLFALTSVEQLPFLNGQEAHYKVMNDTDYSLAMDLLK